MIADGPRRSADELYALAPEDFTAARNERATLAKKSGDTELAGQIRTLTKPNAAAYLANRLVREQAEDVASLLALGDEMRAALLAGSGDRLRELAKVQRQLISALVQQAIQSARAGRRTVPDTAARDLADTLRAALTDRAAAQQLLAGQLTGPLVPSGLDDGAVAIPAAQRAAADGAAADGHAEHAAADGAAERARELLQAASTLTRQAQQDDADSSAAVAAATCVVQQHEAQLARADAELAQRRDQLAQAHTELAHLQSAAETIRSRWRTAQRREELARRRADEYGHAESE